MSDELLQDAWRLHQAGNFTEAARLYNEVLRDETNNFNALQMLGFLHFQRGEFQDAERIMARALAINPNSIDALYNRGCALLNAKRHAEALEMFERATALQPAMPDALVGRAVALLELGRYAEALASADEALTIDGRHTNALINRANALQELNRHAEALTAYAGILSADPGNAAAWNNRGAAFLELRRYKDALDCFGRALAIDKSFSGANLNRAKVLFELGRIDETLDAFGQVLSAEPHNAYARHERASLYLRLKRFEEAASDFASALAADPNYKWARGHLTFCRLSCCDWRNLENDRADIGKRLQAGERVTPPFDNLAICASPEEQLQCAQAWAANECPSAAPLWRGERYSHDRIRLAYVSADLNNSAVATLMAGVFEGHDRTRFETIAISFGPKTVTPMRTRLEAAFGRFIDVREKSDTEIAAQMRAMEVDIAVDLMGYTGECRPRIFAARPAPVQVNYLGFPGTMGAPYMDYIVADRTVILEAQRRHYSEKIAYLPDTYLPADATRSISSRVMSRAAFGLPENGFVFCSFNNTYKFSPALFDVWMRLLTSIPESVLWLPESHPLAMRNLRQEAAARSVAAERIVFAAPVPASDEHLARLRLADLFLDTLPYNAHTTASDALWAGLPLLTCMGQSFAGRVAAGLLNAIGLPELVTRSLDEYEALALCLAREPMRLAVLKAKLERNRGTSPLFDTARYTRNLESAYVTMWNRSQRGEPAASLAVDGAS